MPMKNRIKVLFDALRVPKDGSEIALKTNETSPNPIYRLMEDHKLVTGIKVTTGQLLVPETTKDAEACVSIHVRIRSIHPETPHELRD